MLVVVMVVVAVGATQSGKRTGWRFEQRGMLGKGRRFETINVACAVILHNWILGHFDACPDPRTHLPMMAFVRCGDTRTRV